MPRNEFLPFATRSTANVVEQDEYADSAFVKDGFVSGLAKSAEINKAIRQSTSIASSVAQFIADGSGDDVLDDGDIVKIKNSLDKTIRDMSDVPKGGKKGQALIKKTDADKDVEWNNISGIPKGGDAGQALVKKSNADDDVTWKHVSGVPIGTLEYFAMTVPPVGYLIANGAAVGRMTYPDLFSAIGTTFGEGDGETTFNLPDLIDRFAEGSATPGMVKEAGLPNIEGKTGDATWSNVGEGSGCINTSGGGSWSTGAPGYSGYSSFAIDAHLSNPIYGASDTVQPPALTLLPCIKAFDAATHPGLIDMTGLANDVANKADRDFSNVTQTAIDTSIKWSRPDWSAPVDITNSFIAKGDSYTFSASGIILVTSFDNGYVYLSLNENDVISSGTNIVASDSATGVAYATITTVYENLKLYVTLTSSSNFKVIFYPLAGTQ